MFAHIHVYYYSVKSTNFWHTVILLFFFGKNTTYFSYMQVKRRENAKYLFRFGEKVMYLMYVE